jgi:choline dehydrogenase
VAETIAVGKGFYDATGGLEAPATMMRSRLGPREELARFGVEPVVDLPGVGRGVRTRNETSVISKVSPLEMGRLLLQARSRNGAISLVARKSQPGLREADGVHIILMGAKFRGYNWGYSRKAVGPYMTQLDLQGNTHSRGTIRLRSLDPRDSLEIKLNMFDPRNDPEGLDRKQVIKGFRDMVARAKRMGHKEILDHETDTWKPISYFEKLSDHEIGDRMEREAWDHHVGSSTRMGRGNDPMAVLGSDFRAKGTQNYFVIGHSAYPKPLGYFPVSGIEVGAVKAADGAYQRYFTGQR